MTSIYYISAYNSVHNGYTSALCPNTPYKVRPAPFVRQLTLQILRVGHSGSVPFYPSR